MREPGKRRSSLGMALTGSQRLLLLDKSSSNSLLNRRQSLAGGTGAPNRSLLPYVGKMQEKVRAAETAELEA